ncbi:MAG: hexitol phosphatase HxpB [Bacteroidota bacterium]|nr:hexitol phosphatase HxpB [Bacteroidota bacterium]
MIDTLIFDMDGLLIDSEPYWKLAEKEVFGELGLNLNDELLRQVMGFRLSEVVSHWYHFKPWPSPDFIKTEQDVLECVKQLIHDHADAMPGVYETLAASKSKGYKMALASSSAMSLIEVVVEKLKIKDYFSHLISAESDEYGKPHPGIFIRTAAIMNSKPANCLVIEDSVNGMIAAKAARMQCLVVPEPEKFEDGRFELADYKMRSLTEFNLQHICLD